MSGFSQPLRLQIASCFALSQSAPPFAFRGAPSPLHAHVGFFTVFAITDCFVLRTYAISILIVFDDYRLLRASHLRNLLLHAHVCFFTISAITDCFVLRTLAICPSIRIPRGPSPAACSCRGVSAMPAPSPVQARLRSWRC